MKMIDDIRKTKKCTFCKHWCDFTNSNIKPKPGAIMWEYDTTMKCECTKGRGKRRASCTCKDFENKIR